MKKLSLLLLLPASIIFSGCSTNFKVTPQSGQTQQQYYADKVECKNMASYRSSSASVGYAGGYASSGKSVDNDLFFDCLRSKGYRIDFQ